MKTVQVGGFGAEHVKVAEAADPSPGQGEVLIATEAATVNPADFAVVPGPAVRQIVPGGADALLDTASVAGPALAAVRDGGKYVTVTALPSPQRGIDVFRAGGRMDAPALRILADMASSGRLHTPVAHAYSIDDARAAYEAFARRPGRGRLVLSFPAATCSIKEK
jgi:NADPH:quinone reductase